MTPAAPRAHTRRAVNLTKMRHQLARATTDSRPPRTVTGLTPYQADRALSDFRLHLRRSLRPLHREVSS